MATSISAVAIADVRLFYPILIRGHEITINNGTRCTVDEDVTTCEKLCLRLQQQKEYRGKRVNMLDTHLNTLPGNAPIGAASYVEVMLDHSVDGQPVMTSGRQAVIRPVSPTKPRGLVRPSSPAISEPMSRTKSPEQQLPPSSSSSASSSSIIYTHIPQLPPLSPRNTSALQNPTTPSSYTSQTSHYAPIPPMATWVAASSTPNRSPRGVAPTNSTSPRGVGSPVNDRSPQLSPRPNQTSTSGWKFPQAQQIQQQQQKSSTAGGTFSSLSQTAPLFSTTSPNASPPVAFPVVNPLSSLPPPPAPIGSKGSVPSTAQKKQSIVIPLSDLGVLAGQEEEEYRRRETNAFSEMKKLQEDFDQIVTRVRDSLSEVEKRERFLDAIIRDLVENKPIEASPSSTQTQRKMEHILSADPKTLTNAELMIRNAEELRRKKAQTETKWKFAEKQRKQNEVLKRAIFEEEERKKKKLSVAELNSIERERKRGEIARNNNVQFLEFCSREGLIGAMTWNASQMDSSLSVRFELEYELQSEEERRAPRLTLAQGGGFLCLKYFPLFPRAVIPQERRRARNVLNHTAHRLRIATAARKHLVAEMKKTELESQLKLEKAKKRANELALSGNPRMSLLLSSTSSPTAPSPLVLTADDFAHIDRMLKVEAEKNGNAEKIERVKRKLKAARAEGDLLAPKVKVQRDVEESELDFLARKLNQKQTEREEFDILVRITQSSQPLLLAMDSISERRGSHSSIAMIWDEVDTILRKSLELRKDESEEIDPIQQLDHLIELSKKIKTPHQQQQNSAHVTSVSTSVLIFSRPLLSDSLPIYSSNTSALHPLPPPTSSSSTAPSLCNSADLVLDLQSCLNQSPLPSPRRHQQQTQKSTAAATTGSIASSSASSSLLSSSSSPTSPRKANAPSDSAAYLKANNYASIFAATSPSQAKSAVNLLPALSSATSPVSSPPPFLSKSANLFSSQPGGGSVVSSTLSRSTNAIEDESKAEQAAAKAAASISFRRLETAALPTTSSPTGSGLARLARAPPLTSTSSSGNPLSKSPPPSSWSGSPKIESPQHSPRPKQQQMSGFVGDHRPKKERLADLLMRMSASTSTPPQLSFEAAMASRSTGQLSPRPGPSQSSLAAHQEAIQLLDDLLSTDSTFSWPKEKEEFHKSGVSMSALDELDRLLLAAKATK